MGRSGSIFARFAIIAAAVAMLFVCIRTAQAQSDNRYGFVPVPAPSQPNQTQQPMQPPPMQAPPPTQQQAAQGFTPAPAQPYGYRPLDDSRYGTQMAANPNAYYLPPDNGQNFNAGYQLGPGDKLHIAVFGEDDLSGEYQVDESGMIRLPLVGTLRAAGQSAPMLQNAIGAALAQGYLKNPRVSVEITAYRPFYIIGAVNRPGEYPYVDNLTALNAIALGGGYTEQARESTVFVRHEGSATEQELPASQLTHIYPGDVVRVKTTLFWDAMGIFTPLAGPAAIAAAALN